MKMAIVQNDEVLDWESAVEAGRNFEEGKSIEKYVVIEKKLKKPSNDLPLRHVRTTSVANEKHPLFPLAYTILYAVIFVLGF